MIASRRVRLAVRLAGLACLVAAFLPYYSRTAGPPSGAGVPAVEVPVLGTLPDRSGTTFVRIGLPWSPWFTYRSETTVESSSMTQPAAGGASRIKVESGDLKVGGEVTTVNFSYENNWRFEIVSWSAALALLGVVLLAASFWWPFGRSHEPPAAPADGAGTTAGPGA